MKILQIGKFYPIRGGVEKVMYDLMLGLADRNIHCDMLCATTEDHRGGIIAINSYAKVIAMPTQIKFAATMIAPKMILKLRQIADDYDIIHIHHPDPMACLVLFLSGYKGKVILHWHSDILKQKMLLKLYSPLQSWLIKRANLIVGTTPVYVQESTFLNKVQYKTDYIPIGVEPIVHDIAKVEAIQQKYENKKIIFSLGRLVEYKGYEYLIRAAQYLDEQYQIIIGGKGPLHDELQQLIMQLGVQDRVELIGFISDDQLPAYYGACDVFCLSSIMKTEAFAIVQIEAMSCAKPVISTNIPGSGVSWVNANKQSGLVVEIENSKAIAKAIHTILDNKETYDQLSIGSLQRYQTFFTREKMVDKCLKIYNRLIPTLEKDKIIVPNKFLFEQVLEYLRQGKQVTIPVKGTSMRPFLREGDRVSLEPFEKKDLTGGIIVLAKTDDQMVLHRVVKYNEHQIWLAGDGNLVKHELVDYTDVVATAVRVYRDGAKININQRWRCVLGQIWYWIRPFRRIIMKFNNL